MVTIVCKQCGKSVLRPKRTNNGGKPVLFCSQTCNGMAHRGTGSYRFKRGTYIDRNGYVMVREYINPRKRSNRIFEHILVAEAALGKTLPKKAVVHHHGANRSDNTRNLVICQNQAYHLLLEARTRRLRDVGSFDLKRCRICKDVKPISEFAKRNSYWDRLTNLCRNCDHNNYKLKRSQLLQIHL